MQKRSLKLEDDTHFLVIDLLLTPVVREMVKVGFSNDHTNSCPF